MFKILVAVMLEVKQHIKKKHVYGLEEHGDQEETRLVVQC